MTTEPYNVYIGAASSNPGPSAVTVVVRKGQQEFEETIKVKHAGHDEILLIGLKRATELTEGKSPVVLYTNRMVIFQNANRDKMEPIYIKGEPDTEHGKILTKVRRIAFCAAFPEGVYPPA